MTRRLLVVRRTIPLDRLDEYLPAWESFAGTAGELGGRAWLFRGAGHQDRFVEFLEWDANGPPLPECDPLPSLRSALDACGTPHEELLEEAP